MNRTVQRVCAWSGVVGLALMLIGIVALAQFIPTRSPAQSAGQVAEFLIGDRTRIKWGLVVFMFGASLLMPYIVSMSIHMRRIEGRYPALAMIQLGLGALGVLEVIYPLFFWQTATYRVDRAPELIQLLNDMAWIPFCGLTGTLVLQIGCFGIAVLMDRRPSPIFPRWLGYFNLWAALMVAPGAINVFFQQGIFAWNGLIAWYLPVVAFGVWVVINSIFLAKAVEGMDDDDNPDDDLRQLRADVDRLLAQNSELRGHAGGRTV